MTARMELSFLQVINILSIILKMFFEAFMFCFNLVARLSARSLWISSFDKNCIYSASEDDARADKISIGSSLSKVSLASKKSVESGRVSSILLRTKGTDISTFKIFILMI